MDFNRYAKPYTWLTDHALWREAMREVAKQLPPSGSQLKLLDLTCGSGISLGALKALRPDILAVGLDLAYEMLRIAKTAQLGTYYLHADAYQTPFAANSFDAVLIQRSYYFMPRKTALLAEALRVLRPGGRLVMLDPHAERRPRQALSALKHGPRAALDMFALHLAAHHMGGYTPESIAEDLVSAGYARILAETVMEGWAVMSRGEKPYAAEASTVERVAVGAADAALDKTGLENSVLRGNELRQTPGRYVHLLIQQTPNLPAWKLTPETVVTWGAAGVQPKAPPPTQAAPLALAFTALPKAVAFMQQAVMVGAVQDVSKVAKFSKATAADWDFSVVMNPTLEAVQAAYHLPAIWLSIDPTTAEAPDE